MIISPRWRQGRSFRFSVVCGRTKAAVDYRSGSSWRIHRVFEEDVAPSTAFRLTSAVHIERRSRGGQRRWDVDHPRPKQAGRWIGPRGSARLRYNDQLSERGRWGGRGRSWRSSVSTEIKSKSIIRARHGARAASSDRSAVTTRTSLRIRAVVEDGGLVPMKSGFFVLSQLRLVSRLRKRGRG